MKEKRSQKRSNSEKECSRRIAGHQICICKEQKTDAELETMFLPDHWDHLFLILMISRTGRSTVRHTVQCIKRYNSSMKKDEAIASVLMVQEILQSQSDEQHRISMPELSAALELEGVPSGRRVIYACVQALKNRGVPVHFSRSGGKQGYWIDHLLTPAEAFVVTDLITQSPSLSSETAERLSDRIRGLLSEADQKLLKLPQSPLPKTGNDEVLMTIEILLKAISRGSAAEFRYFDRTLSGERSYRRNGIYYHMVPYAIVSDASRYYCIFRDSAHQDFSNYRIDKMDSVQDTGIPEPLMPFDLERYLQSSFRMYHGTPVTITVEFDLSLLNQVLDQFGQDLLISKVTDHTFTASIRSAVTPTMIGWLLQFYDRIRVIAPDSLIEEFCRIAASINSTYNGKELEAPHGRITGTEAGEASEHH